MWGSKVVPFFRAVQAKKTGCMSTPKGAKPPIHGLEATSSFLGGCPMFVSFCYQSCSNCKPIRTKLGWNDLWAKPDGSALADLRFITTGLSYLLLKVKIWVFWPFSREFDTIKGS